MAHIEGAVSHPRNLKIESKRVRLVTAVHYGTKPDHFETSEIHFPTSEGVSKVSGASERMSEWPSTYVPTLGYSGP